ncbi:MAG TPA: FAD-binding protein, partial [Methanomassiliicoccales archaeon]|nr:FAD-binding protein [Methanomassiliicoccales archaeon]
MSEVLVVGSGAAGLFSSWLLARDGWPVIVVGKGTPSSAMSTGCLRRMPEACHEKALNFLADEGMPMVTGERTGISKLGTPFECWLSPSHSTWSPEGAPGSVTVVGFQGHPSLHPNLISSVLGHRGIRARPLTLPSTLPPDIPLTALFRDEGAWEGVATEVQRTEGGTVLLPAFLSRRDYWRLDWLERRCGRTVLEAVTPLEAPGQRLLDLMRARAIEAGASIWDGRTVTSLTVENGSVRTAIVRGGLEVREMEVGALVMATGGALVNGLGLNGRELADPFNAF